MPRDVRSDLRCYGAEFIGTAALVFFAAGSVMMTAALGGLPGPLMSGLASGTIVTVMVWALYGVSGAHLNPALSVTLALFGEFPLRRLPGYIVAQLAGSAAAAAMLFLALGTAGRMGTNLPNTSLGIGHGLAFGLEILLSFLMMLVIRAAFAAEEPLRQFASLPIGAIVGIEVMLMGPVAGAAMNPARAFGPTLLLGEWSAFWIYAVGPLVGLIAAALVWRLLASSPPEPAKPYDTSARSPADWPT
jgi:MIP family channel proteins